MASLFRRAWTVQVDTLDVSNLDIDFEILSSIKSKPNKCVLTVWNLTAEHRAQLLKRNNPQGNGRQIVGVPVKISAGYMGQVPTLFNGDLREVASTKYGSDWKTTLSGDDGGRAYREGRISATFRKGTPVATVLTQVANAMGVGLGNLNSFLSGASVIGIGTNLSGSMVLSGSAATAMDRLTRSMGITWSVQQGNLQLQQRGQPLNASAILISPATGLIGSPEAGIDATVELGNPQQFAPGAKQTVAKPPKPKNPGILRLKTLLIPGLVPGRKIVLQSAAFSGGYQVTECRYQGQSWGEPWWIDCVVRSY